MKNQEPGRFPTDTTPGECAVIICAGENHGFSGTALLARAVSTTPPNERALRGLPA